ncbi:MAG TPA: tRNA 2-thiouridine(34) synthase MnmA [Thermoleophilaceae bacterium]
MDLSPLYDHLTAPRGRGRSLPHAAEAGGASCGDLIRIAVRVEGDRVVEAGFEAEGCAAARAAGSATVERVHGKPFLDAARTTAQDIADELGGLSPERIHAAHLAADALHRALGEASPQVEADTNRTLVAMSGGVDSAVAAQLAIDAGHDVLAVTLELWSDPRTDGTKSCCSPQAVIHARALAHRMGLPHITLDVRDGFRRQVVDDYVSEHEAGNTPNPCVRCNGQVRFDAMLELARKLGAQRLATGHYARIASDAQGSLIRAAADPKKDQSYMLARLRPDELERLWFPLGDLAKTEVRELARSASLPVAERPESQDLCFLSGTNVDEFLGRHEAGEIVDLEGRALGRHDGQHRFTVGQRRGIGVAAAEPLYVVRKERGRVVVGPKQALATTEVSVAGVTLWRDAAEVDRVKLRYRSGATACRIEGEPRAGRHRALTLELDEPALGVAPGQTACLMRGDAVIGFATIAPPRKRPAPTPTPERELSYAR